MKKLIVALMLLVSVGVNAEEKVIKTVYIGETPFQMEYALTPSEQRQGLAFRQEVPDKTGMLFLHQTPHPAAFWMKNTYVALDMIFFDDNYQITNIVENAEPLDETPIMVDGPIKGVLEVPAGSARKYKIQIGDFVKTTD